jgi:hypothetical protein
LIVSLAGGSPYLDAAGIITPIKVMDISDTINLGRIGAELLKELL